jgi:hypothetical protein
MTQVNMGDEVIETDLPAEAVADLQQTAEPAEPVKVEEAPETPVNPEPTVEAPKEPEKPAEPPPDIGVDRPGRRSPLPEGNYGVL